MAKVINKKDISKFPKEIEAWEEYLIGRGLRKVYIRRVNSHVLTKFIVKDDLTDLSTVRSIYERMFRYWDAEPSPEEKNKEPWS